MDSLPELPGEISVRRSECPQLAALGAFSVKDPGSGSAPDFVSNVSLSQLIAAPTHVTRNA